MTTTVVNLRHDEYDVYIGRAGRGESGYFGNPFWEGPRELNIAAFKEDFYRRVWTDADFAQRVLDLRGKRLGCFCKPLPCHGDIIAAWIDETTCEGCSGDPDNGSRPVLATYAIPDPNQEGIAYPDPKQVVYLCRECAK